MRSFLFVSTTGVEPAREYSHYPLKVARLPIPPRGHTIEVGPLCIKLPYISTLFISPTFWIPNKVAHFHMNIRMGNENSFTMLITQIFY